MRNPLIGGALGALTIYLYLEDQHKESDISLISAIHTAFASTNK